MPNVVKLSVLIFLYFTPSDILQYRYLVWSLGHETLISLLCFKHYTERQGGLDKSICYSVGCCVTGSRFCTLILDWDPGTRRIPSESTPFFSRNDNICRERERGKERKRERRRERGKETLVESKHWQIRISCSPLLVILSNCCYIQGVVKAFHIERTRTILCAPS